MVEHLLIESTGPDEGPGCERFVGDAVRLAAAGDEVVLFLVDNGVTAALPGALPPMAELLRHGGRLYVDGYSLGRRALAAADLLPAARLVDMDEVAERLLTPGIRAVWH
ncbi:DsrE family protein [Streptomyces sp. SAJ15]|uniref:DsrE family protein n=1 Tax=Streptomyces sp. SAJ15 TaxID=2011095 RepID=UPI001185F737|nr:DsrE family protein [Streptomyces sp. SAJ15]TVL89236.1 hypothetical protein CD790_29150 [Streptomyces sp. SAJ15]